MHRYYDPSTGKWLTRDPISYAGGINLYAYCENNPVNRYDFLGWFDSSKFTACMKAKLPGKVNMACFDGFSQGLLETFLAIVIGCAVANYADGETLVAPCILALMSRFGFPMAVIFCLKEEIVTIVDVTKECYEEANSCP